MPQPPTPPAGGPARRIRAALVGTGTVAATGHLPALRAQAHRVELAAVVDSDAAVAGRFRAAHGVPAAYSSLAEMLHREHPDLVHLCTPSADAAVQCLEAGAWVLAEQPPARSLAEYDRIEAAERDGGPYASVVRRYGFGSAGRHLDRLVREGALGRPLVAQCVTAWYRPQSAYDVPTHGQWATGGPTLGHGIHQMDLLLAVLGDWEEVRAIAGRLDRDIQTEDVSLALVRFASGAVATVVNSVLSPREESYLRFDFTDVTAEVRHLQGRGAAEWTYTPAPHAAADSARIAAWTAPDGESGSAHAAQLPYVLDAFDKGQRPPASGPAARASLALVTALYRSALTGLPVRRDQLGPDDPFYHHLHGGTPGWAPAPQEPAPEASAPEAGGFVAGGFAAGGREEPAVGALKPLAAPEAPVSQGSAPEEPAP
jgi:predicted dehydrogenase